MARVDKRLFVHTNMPAIGEAWKLHFDLADWRQSHPCEAWEFDQYGWPLRDGPATRKLTLILSMALANAQFGIDYVVKSTGMGRTDIVKPLHAAGIVNIIPRLCSGWNAVLIFVCDDHRVSIPLGSFIGEVRMTSYAGEISDRYEYGVMTQWAAQQRMLQSVSMPNPTRLVALTSIASLDLVVKTQHVEIFDVQTGKIAKQHRRLDDLPLAALAVNFKRVFDAASQLLPGTLVFAECYPGEAGILRAHGGMERILTLSADGLGFYVRKAA